MVLLLLLAMLTACAAVPQDLTGKMFTFPQETNTAHVRLTTSTQELRSLSACLRFFTDLSRNYGLFSLATPSHANDFLIFNEAGNNETDLYVKDQKVDFRGLTYNLHRRHSICVTVDFMSGLAQLWLNGKPSSRKFVGSGSKISGPILIVLGQEQDSHGGGFDINQSFVGMMSDVHLWDHTLTPSEIQNYMEHRSFTSGNVLSWRALDFQAIGRVLIEDQQLIGY
ncbi:serum amyloid P-component-like [Chaetodon auriga]|uniref:serum amyloid P-component-like n=1 Tax=Chaetodon auriga TaxID=39042 RepID=UPI004032F89A